MTKIFSKIYPLILVPVIAACVQIKDKDKHDEVPPPDHYVEATVTPNEFRVHLPPMGGGDEIRRQNLSQDEINPAAVSLEVGVGGNLVDAQVSPGSKYRYEYLNANGSVLRIIEVEIPQDLVIDHEISLSCSPDWQNIYRVYFRNGGILTTNGNNVLLKAQMIYSDHGVIRTFPNGMTAKAEAAGRSGGEIRIFTSNASGDLAIELRGENGGAGQPVSGASNGDIGNGGAGGDSGKFYFDSQSNNQFRITHLIQFGMGGAGAPAVPGRSACIMGSCRPGEILTIPGRKAGVTGVSGQRGEICFAQSGRLLSCEQ